MNPRAWVGPGESTVVLPPLHGRAVLCVDDEPAVLAALRRSLWGEPYDVIATEDPETALDFVGSREIRLVISDHRMPGMTGVELLRAVHERSPATRGLILTGHPGSLCPSEGLGPGVQGVLLKPWDHETLARLLRQLLGEGEEPGDKARCGGGHS